MDNNITKNMFAAVVLLAAVFAVTTAHSITSVMMMPVAVYAADEKTGKQQQQKEDNTSTKKADSSSNKEKHESKPKTTITNKEEDPKPKTTSIDIKSGEDNKKSKKDDNKDIPFPQMFKIDHIVPGSSSFSTTASYKPNKQQQDQDQQKQAEEVKQSQEDDKQLNKQVDQTKQLQQKQEQTTTIDKKNDTETIDKKESKGQQKEEAVTPIVESNKKDNKTQPNPTLPQPPFGGKDNCGPGMKNVTGKCVLDKNCEYKDKNQTVISCIDYKTKKIVLHENIGNSKTTVNNNNNNYYTSSLQNAENTNNIFQTAYNPLLSPSTTTNINKIPQTLLLLDSKQLLDIIGDSQDAGIQALFSTTSFKTTYSAETKTWFITGTVQNINTITPPTNIISNVTASVIFYDANGNTISIMKGIPITPNILAHDEEGRFMITASLDTDLLGKMPTFMAINYNFF